MEDIIWEEDDTRELFSAIKASGGLQELPLITEEGVVKEGNRRIVCLRKLRPQVNEGKFEHIKPGTLDNVPVKVLSLDITAVEIDVLMARYHVSGKKEWAALNQAERISRMYNEEGLPVERIAEVIGKSKPWVYQKIWAFEKTVEFLKKFPTAM